MALILIEKNDMIQSIDCTINVKPEIYADMYTYKADELIRIVLKDIYKIYDYDNSSQVDMLSPKDGFYLFEEDGNIGNVYFQSIRIFA
jgi:hypothetical protein